MSSTWTQHLALKLLARQISYESLKASNTFTRGVFSMKKAIWNEMYADMFDGITL